MLLKDHGPNGFPSPNVREARLLEQQSHQTKNLPAREPIPNPFDPQILIKVHDIQLAGLHDAEAVTGVVLFDEEVPGFGFPPFTQVA